MELEPVMFVSDLRTSFDLATEQPFDHGRAEAAVGGRNDRRPVKLVPFEVEHAVLASLDPPLDLNRSVI